MKIIILLSIVMLQMVASQNLLLPSLQLKESIDYKIYNLRSDQYCSNDITFFSAGMAILSGGCEAREHVRYCYWKLVGDSVELLPAKGPSHSLVKNLAWSAHDRGDTTTFIVTDMNDRNVQHFVFAGICENTTYQRLGLFGEHIYAPQHRVPEYMIGDSNYVTIPTNDIDSLILTKLEMYSRQKYVLSTKNLPDTVYIQLAIDAVPLYYNEIIWDEIDKPLKFKVLYKDAQKKEWDIEIKNVPSMEQDLYIEDK